MGLIDGPDSQNLPGHRDLLVDEEKLFVNANF